MSLKDQVAALSETARTEAVQARDRFLTETREQVEHHVRDVSGYEAVVVEYQGEVTVAQHTYQNTRYTPPGVGLVHAVRHEAVHVVLVDDVKVAVKRDAGGRYWQAYPLFEDPEHGPYLAEGGLTLYRNGDTKHEVRDHFAQRLGEAYARRPRHPVHQAGRTDCPTCLRPYNVNEV